MPGVEDSLLRGGVSQSNNSSSRGVQGNVAKCNPLTTEETYLKIKQAINIK